MSILINPFLAPCRGVAFYICTPIRIGKINKLGNIMNNNKEPQIQTYDIPEKWTNGKIICTLLATCKDKDAVVVTYKEEYPDGRLIYRACALNDFDMDWIMENQIPVSPDAEAGAVA